MHRWKVRWGENMTAREEELQGGRRLTGGAENSPHSQNLQGDFSLSLSCFLLRPLYNEYN